MVKVIPDTASYHGEQIAINAIKNSFERNNYYCLSSQGIDGRRPFEIDLILITDKIIICLEVKGCEELRCRDGKWTFINKKNSYTKSISPFRQSQNTKYELEKILEKRLPSEIYKKVRVDWAVIFPKMNFDPKLTTEAKPERICDLSKINNFENFIKDFYEFSPSNKSQTPLNHKEIKQIIEILRPDIDIRTGLNFFINETETNIAFLESEQKNTYLNIISGKYPQNIIKGGPGSGKTFLAIELSKKISEEGKSIAFFCFNIVLAKNIRKKLSENNNSKTKVFHVHDFMYKQINKAGKKRWLKEEREDTSIDEQIYFSEVLPSIFKQSVEDLYEQSDLEQFDHIIFDEAQDFMNKDIIEPILNYCIKGKISEKSWTIFLDDNIQKEVYGAFDPEYLQKLEFENQRLYLSDNYRNPQNFINKACQIAGIKDEPRSKRNLKKIINIQNYKRSEDYTDLLDKIKKTLITILQKEKIEARFISILVPDKQLLSIIVNLEKIANKKFIDIADLTNMSELVDEITVSTVSSFKGLENQIILLIDNSNFHLNDWQKSIYYVGMTRALTDLYFFTPEDSVIFK